MNNNMDGRPLPNGQPARSNGIPQQALGAGNLRVPTVHEALPYTPFSSIVPFSPDIIPPPFARPTTATSAFAGLQEVAQAKRTLEQLSAGATSAEHASNRCQQTLRDVQKLLDPDSLTQFKFIRPRGSSPSGADNHVNTSNVFRTPHLSPFAKMVFDGADVPYRYLTPESPEPQSRAGASVTSSRKKVNLPTPQAKTKHIEPVANGYATPQQIQVPNGSQGPRLQVVVPNSVTPAQLAEYQYISEADTINVAQAPTPSKRHDSSLTNAQRAMSVDQKQKGDLAVHGLESLLSDIFAAEDQLEPDSSRALGNGLLTLRYSDEGTRPVLLPEAQVRLDSSVQKVVTIGRLESIDIDSLIHCQRLCESAVAEVENTMLRIGEEWSEKDAEEWVQRLATAEQGVIAARTLMRIMGAGARIKELQSEDYLRGILAALRTVIESCIVPVVEDRYSSHEKIRGSKEEPLPNPSFIMASSHRRPLQTLLNTTTKAYRILGDFLVKSDFDESSLSSVQAMCTSLLFAENASSERDSVLGIQTFENTRRCAMDVLAKIFAKYMEQRQYILDIILTSLERLPATKQSARQYRLNDAKPIQLVSALLMRLVQTSATHSGESARGRSKAAEDEHSEDEADAEGSADEDYDDEEVIRVSPKKARHQPEDLISIAKPLHDAAQSNASYITKVLIQRALSSSKSSDEPYRKLLDIFTEDFLNVLGSSDWPSAEMLLRTLVLHMINMAEGPKSTGGARSLALELLGTIGTGILDIQMSARNAVRSMGPSESDIGPRLASLVEQLETGDIEVSSLVAFDGPYRMVVEYVQARDLNDAQLRSAQGYQLMQWAFLVCGGREGSTDSDSSGTPRPAKDLQGKLRNMILDMRWLEEHADYQSISTQQGRLAAMVVTLSSKLCKAFNRIFSILLASMSSDQPKVKSRALKSVVTLLEKDPSILDRNAHVLNHIFRCCNDASPLVRDSALMLIADCVKLRPALDKTVYDRVVARTKDASTGVRKRALKFLKDLYLGNQSMNMRIAIADAVIARMQDTEESVVEIARQIMEEIWFQPFHNLKLEGDGAVEAKLRYGAQASLLIRTVEASEGNGVVLETLIKQLAQSKSSQSHVAVCQTLIRILFDGIIDSSEIQGAPDQPAILRCLAVFAIACPKLFTASQLERLEPYTQNLTKADDLEVYRSAITILRHVMPHQSALKHDFLQNLQTALLASVSKLPRSELNEVVPCLWTIDGMLGNTERLVKFVMSALNNVYALRSVDFKEQPQPSLKASRLMLILGQFGKACDFEKHLPMFKSQFTWYKGPEVTGLLIEIICPFTSPKQPVPIRQAALEAVCLICYSSPQMLLREDVVTAFNMVFKDRNPALEEVLLDGLESFFSAGETSTGGGDVPQLGSGVASGTERLGRTYVATDQDGASISIARRFLPEILRIALSSRDQLAFIASKIIVSLNRQGLVHPKACGPALVALETCPNSAIANMAFVEHKAQHSKHESLFDKEYMHAVQQTYEYQRNVIGDAAGYIGHPPGSKLSLLWEVLKTGKAQVRKKFLSNLAHKLDFSLQDLNATGVASQHLSFVRFCAENLAFFEYDRIEELLHLLTAMEKIFSGTGVAIAQAVESEVLRLQVDNPVGSDATMNGTSETIAVKTTSPSVDPERLQQLAAASQICSLIWETRSFIRRLWNLQKHVAKPKNAAKESNRAPTRATNAPALADAYLAKVGDIMGASASQESQHAICSSFVDIISVDSEIKIGSEEEGEDAELANGYDTPSEGTSRKSPSAPPSGGGRGRKRKSGIANGTPRKRGRPSMGKRMSSAAKLTGVADEDGGWD